MAFHRIGYLTPIPVQRHLADRSYFQDITGLYRRLAVAGPGLRPQQAWVESGGHQQKEKDRQEILAHAVVLTDEYTNSGSRVRFFEFCF